MREHGRWYKTEEDRIVAELFRSCYFESRKWTIRIIPGTGIGCGVFFLMKNEL